MASPAAGDAPAAQQPPAGPVPVGTLNYALATILRMEYFGGALCVEKDSCGTYTLGSGSAYHHVVTPKRDCLEIMQMADYMSWMWYIRTDVDGGFSIQVDLPFVLGGESRTMRNVLPEDLEQAIKDMGATMSGLCADFQIYS